MLLRMLHQVGFGNVRNSNHSNSYGDMITFIDFLASHGWLSSSKGSIHLEQRWEVEVSWAGSCRSWLGNKL